MFTEQLPVRRIFEEWPTDGETMEFRLMLTGKLPSNRRAGVDAKHRIRRELHPQLKMLWQQHPALHGLFDPDKNKKEHRGSSNLQMNMPAAAFDSCPS